MNNQDDLRKTVRNSTGKKKKKNNRPIIMLALILIIAIVVIINNAKKSEKVSVQEITNYNYFVITTNENKSGVINKEGKIIINPEYDSIQIPNPEKPVFICLYDYNSEKREYSSKVLNEKSEEILKKYDKVQAIANNNTSVNNAYQTTVLKYKNDDKYGLIKINGKKLTSAIYDEIETLEYKDGVLKVKQGDKYGIVDLNGKEIIKVEYNSIVADGYYDKETKYEKAGYIVNVKTDEGYRYGYINSKGKQTLDTTYTNLKRATDMGDSAIYMINYKNGKAGLLKDSQTIIKNDYEDIEIDAENQIASVQKNGKKGVYDLLGNMILPIQYDDIIFAGKCINASKDGKVLVFDLAGVIQSESPYRSITKVANGKYSITINRDNQYGVIDNNKVEIIGNKYSYIEYAFDNYFVVSKNGMSGLLNSESKEIIQINKNVVQNIKGTQIIQTIDSKAKITELYNKDMQKVATQSDARIYIKDNYIELVSKDNIEYFDFDGNKKDAKDLFDNKIYAKEQNGKWGYVDKNGNTVVDFKYDMATNLNKYGYGAIRLNDKWGAIDSNGNIIKEPIYELSDYEPNFIGEYYEVNNIYQMSYFSNETKIKQGE